MPHPEIDNQTRLQFAPLFVADEEGRPVVGTLVKATFTVSAAGGVALADEQAPVDFAGKHHGEPGKSSYRVEPEIAFVKPAVDLVLLGHALADRPGTTQMALGFRVGDVQVVARATGDRHWEPALLGTKISNPLPFERIPLTYERAFGGWDRTPAKPEHHDCEPSNPVGLGFAARRGKVILGAPLPNIESVDRPLRHYGERAAVVGFGFVCPDWQPRASHAGTYDAAWSKDRAPLLPKDFDRRFFNAAAPGLTTSKLAGNEPVVTLGVTPEGKWAFWLPGLPPPRCLVALRSGDQDLELRLDTVIVDADARRLTLLWRAHTVLRTGPHDVRAFRITLDDPRVRKPPPRVAARA